MSESNAARLVALIRAVPAVWVVLSLPGLLCAQQAARASLATTQKYTQVSIKQLIEVYDKTHPKA